MRGMVEIMHDGDPGRERDRLAVRLACVRERTAQPWVLDLSGPVEDVRVGGLAVARERREVAIQVGPVTGLGIARTREAREPDAIGPHQMRQRPLDGAEERAALARALGRVHGGDERVEPLVHPAVVAREELAIRRVDHRAMLTRSPACPKNWGAARAPRRATEEKR